MKGKYDLVVYNNSLRYELELKRNITIVKGKSGTGKTTLYNMLADSKKRNSGVHCNMADKVVILYGGTDRETVLRMLNEHKNKIFIADCGIEYIYTDWFIESILKSDNYFILLSRGLNIKCNSYELMSTKEGKLTVTRLRSVD